jgi:hypothetical protein
VVATVDGLSLRRGLERRKYLDVGEKSSLGYEWIELESPILRMFNANGDPSKYLTHAIRQILDWRAWLKTKSELCATLPRRSRIWAFMIFIFDVLFFAI